MFDDDTAFLTSAMDSVDERLVGPFNHRHSYELGSRRQQVFIRFHFVLYDCTTQRTETQTDERVQSSKAFTNKPNLLNMASNFCRIKSKSCEAVRL